MKKILIILALASPSFAATIGGTWVDDSAAWARARASAVWTPASISGLQLWFDATTESYANNNSVTTLHDRSSNGWDAVQPIAARQPTFKTNTPAVYFDGSDDSLRIGDHLNNPALFSIFIVEITSSTSGNGALYGKFTYSTGTAGYFHYVGGDYTFWQSATANYDYIYTGSNHKNDTKYEFTWTMPSAILDQLLYLNNSNLGTLSNVGSPSHNVSNPETFALGAFADGSYWWRGSLCEFIVYDSVLSSADRGTVHSYLQTKWGF